MMRKIFITLLISAFSSLLIAGNNDYFGLVKVEGNAFTDTLGNEMVFRGLAIAEPSKLLKNGQWNEDFFIKVKEWNANIIRIPVHPESWRKLGSKEYLKLIDQGVEWATKHQLYVILVWHSMGNLKTELFQLPYYDTTKKETLYFWKMVASRYIDNTTVAFYEIFNEPTTFGGKLGRMTWAEWKVLAEEMIDLIYAHDKKKIPLVAGLKWAYTLEDMATNPIEYEGIGYIVHPYPTKSKEPWTPAWEKSFGFVKDKYPLIATEFGFEENGPIPTHGTEHYGNEIINYLENKKISWTVWCFDPQWRPTLIKSWDFQPTRQGVLFKEFLKINNK